MKDNNEVISEFNEYVNMTASELEKWLKSDDSNSAGWTKDGGEGESVGHDSGRKIVEILKANPDKTPDKYTDDQLQHMRKVASYCKRHLAQESSGNKDKDPEDVKQTKSYISLKNWGHDFLKAQGKESGSANGSGKPGSKKEKEGDQEEDAKENGKSGSKKDKEETTDQKEDEDENEAENDQEEEKEEEKDKKAGDKRKKSGQQNGSNKKQQTRQTRSSKKKESEGDVEEEAGDDQEGDDDGDDDDVEEEEEEEKGKSEGKSGKKGPKKGETVSWNWGNGNPQGKVLDVKEEKYVASISQP